MYRMWPIGGGMLLLGVMLIGVVVIVVWAAYATTQSTAGRTVPGPPAPPAVPAPPAMPAPPAPPTAPEQVLADRFARGEIDDQEYRRRLETLRGSGLTRVG